MKTAQTLQAGAVGGEFFVKIAEEGQGALQAVKGLHGLVHIAYGGLSFFRRRSPAKALKAATLIKPLPKRSERR